MFCPPPVRRLGLPPPTSPPPQKKKIPNQTGGAAVSELLQLLCFGKYRKVIAFYQDSLPDSGARAAQYKGVRFVVYWVFLVW